MKPFEFYINKCACSTSSALLFHYHALPYALCHTLFKSSVLHLKSLICTLDSLRIVFIRNKEIPWYLNSSHYFKCTSNNQLSYESN